MFLFAKKYGFAVALVTLAGASIITFSAMRENVVAYADEKTAVTITTNASNIEIGEEFDVLVNVHSKYDNKAWLSNDVRLLSNAYDKLSFVSSSIENENPNIESLMGSDISYANNTYLCGLFCADKSFTTSEDIVYKVTFKLDEVIDPQEGLSFYVDASKINIKYSDGVKETKTDLTLSNTESKALEVGIEELDVQPISISFETETRTPVVEEETYTIQVAALEEEVRTPVVIDTTKSTVSLTSDMSEVASGKEFVLYITADSKFDDKVWFAQQAKVYSEDFDKVSLVSSSVVDKVAGEETLFGSEIIDNSYLCSVMFNNGNLDTTKNIVYALTFKVNEDVEVGSTIGFYLDKSTVLNFYKDNSKENKKDIELVNVASNKFEISVIENVAPVVEAITVETNEVTKAGNKAGGTQAFQEANDIYVDVEEYQNVEYIEEMEEEYIETNVEIYEENEAEIVEDKTIETKTVPTKTQTKTATKTNTKKTNNELVTTLFVILAIVLAGGSLIAFCKIKLKLF